MLTTAALTAFDELQRGGAWQRWRTLTEAAPPYLAPEFFALERPLVDADAPVVVAGAWTAEAMTGALPLVLDGRTLRGLRTDHAPGYDFCGTADGIAAIWRCLRDDPRWDELVLDRVPAASLLARALPALAQADGCPVAIRADAAHPVFVLPQFEAHLKPKFRANLTRCARKAGEVALERLAHPTAADFADAERLEALAWKAEAGTAIALDPRVVALYERTASLAFLRIDGVRAAVLFVVEDAHTLYALKTGFDPAYAAVSPGHLLIWKLAADAERRGLRELDFVGRADEWKRRWTERVAERVILVIYRRSVRGLARYALRELVKPRLPATVRASWRSPLPRRCQRADIVGDHPLARLLYAKVRAGLGVRPALRRAWRASDPRAVLAPAHADGPRLGSPSRFAVGSYVRVRDADAIRATLDPRGALRGLAFTPAQYHACGQVFRVARHVRRLRDDHGRFRAVSSTVLLDGVDCGFGHAEPAGCGRRCPLMFRDDWLEEAPALHLPPPTATHGRHARVRDPADIARGLDLSGRRDGLTFMPEMARFAGQRLPIVGQLARAFEHDRWIAPRQTIYLLGGAACDGAACGDDGPCDRACALLWHKDWLYLEPVPPSGGATSR